MKKFLFLAAATFAAATVSAQITEDFKPASTNQEGKQYPMVNSQRMVRAQISAPQATSVKLDIGGVKYDMVKDEKGVKIATSVVNDGVKKLNARRKIMSYVYDIQEQRKDKETLASFEARTKDINHPLVEKIFNVYAPKYAERAEKLGQGGGYTRIVKLGQRRGDAGEKALIELI